MSKRASARGLSSPLMRPITTHEIAVTEMKMAIAVMVTGSSMAKIMGDISNIPESTCVVATVMGGLNVFVISLRIYTLIVMIFLITIAPMT